MHQGGVQPLGSRPSLPLTPEIGEPRGPPHDTCPWRAPPHPSTHRKGREGERAAPTPSAPTASVRPPQSAARPQLAWCLCAPITPSITAPEAAEGREGEEGEGRGKGGPGGSSPAGGPGLAETSRSGLLGKSRWVPSPCSPAQLRGPLSSRFWAPPGWRPRGLPPPNRAPCPMPHSFQPLYKPQFPHPCDVSSVKESQCLACLVHPRHSIVNSVTNKRANLSYKSQNNTADDRCLGR